MIMLTPPGTEITSASLTPRPTLAIGRGGVESRWRDYQPKEGLHDRRERTERKAHGAQRPRKRAKRVSAKANLQVMPELHNNELGEGASTAQRSDPFAQQVVQTLPKNRS